MVPFLLFAFADVRLYPERKRGNAAHQPDTLDKRIALLSPRIPA
jgi:hypothetical protein